MRPGRASVDIEVGLGERRSFHGGVRQVGQLDAGEEDRLPCPAGERPDLLLRVFDDAGHPHAYSPAQG
ncbi:hypothetical protein ADL28_30130 [Streptomyces violaceusniger]|uniref:Uncharacterized protein n=1 Tax=Streptomyces violaceusniger TaxID=68280 RepID=A0A0X3VU50_STRVO|nr:hypothetical protein ADL28_30130 [Streptomyces violaceusniger]